MRTLKLIIKPDEEEPDAAEVLVDGTIGDRAYRFLLDTGAARSSVLFDTYTATLPSVDRHDSSGVFASSRSDLVTVPSIRVGPVAAEQFTLVRAAENSEEKRNLIGMDLLKERCCLFRFEDNQVLVGANEEAWAGAAVQELVLDEGFHPYVDVQFGEVKASSVWDTGAGITIVDMAFVERHPDLFQPAGVSTGTDGTGASRETPMYRMEPPVIGGRQFPPIKVAGVDLSHANATIERPMDLILGYNVLSQANWLFDFPGRKWAIVKMLGEG